jgi:hypothetical protein
VGEDLIWLLLRANNAVNDLVSLPQEKIGDSVVCIVGVWHGQGVETQIGEE